MAWIVLAFRSRPSLEAKRFSWRTRLYFSFVTLGTLGYGDITPVGGPARALAVSEAIVGQMYLVVVVARLVSLYEGSALRDERRQRDKAINVDENSG